MPEFMIRVVAKVGFGLVRFWLLHRSDRAIAKRIRFIRRVLYAITADPFILTALGDVAGIFETGGRGTELVRKMFREATPEYAEAVVRAGMRKD